MTWELGANYGHLTRLILVADSQRALGREVLFAVCDLDAAQKLLTLQGYAYMAAPRLKCQTSNVLLPSYIQLLLAVGYADQPALQEALGDWLNLFNEYQPDLIIADHSPTALLANHIAKIPAIQLGSGFEIPPTDQWPETLPFNPQQKLQLKDSEQQLLANMNHALIVHGGLAMQSVTELFKNCHQLLTTFAELDHYPYRNNINYIGPIYSVSSGSEVLWTDTSQKKVFVYVWSGLPGLNRLMLALAELNIEVIAVIPGLSDEALLLFSQPHIRIFKETVRLSALLEYADLLITHSGFGTVSAFLKEGVPVMVIPDTLEQFLVGQCIERLGMGLVMGPRRNQESFKQTVSQLLNLQSNTHSSFREAVNKFAIKYQNYNPSMPIVAVTEAIQKELRE
jgi:UDP:flavonoid glycosyltransferase YjiC (YdhE family)